MDSLTVAGTLESLNEIRQYVNSLSSAAGLSKAQAYGLALAVDEIATNIVLYGYQRAGLSGEIELSAQVSPGMVELMLDDTAIPFNPLEHMMPDDLDAPLAERDIGGLGIFLAKKNVDEYRYSYVNGHNQNIFVIGPTKPDSNN